MKETILGRLTGLLTMNLARILSAFTSLIWLSACVSPSSQSNRTGDNMPQKSVSLEELNREASRRAAHESNLKQNWAHLKIGLTFDEVNKLIGPLDPHVVASYEGLKGGLTSSGLSSREPFPLWTSPNGYEFSDFRCKIQCVQGRPILFMVNNPFFELSFSSGLLTTWKQSGLR